MSFLSTDGYLDPVEFTKLARDLDKYAKSNNLAPTGFYYTTKVVSKFDAEKLKASGPAFTRRRALEVKFRKKMPLSGSRLKMVVVLPLYAGLENDNEVNLAIKAIDKHNAKVESFVVSFKKKAQEAKLKNQKSFNAVVDEMEAILLDSGIPVHDIAIGTNSMGGTTMIAKLPGNKYVSFGLSDAAKFAALKSD